MEMSACIFFNCFSTASSSTCFSFCLSASLSFPDVSGWSRCGGLKYRPLLVMWSTSPRYQVLSGWLFPQSSSVWARHKSSSSHHIPSAADRHLSGSGMTVLVLAVPFTPMLAAFSVPAHTAISVPTWAFAFLILAGSSNLSCSDRINTAGCSIIPAFRMLQSLVEFLTPALSGDVFCSLTLSTITDIRAPVGLCPGWNSSTTSG
ncbi:uncharacterized protein LOC114323721 [Camellia sinensis]|uniref:uncharacterized protein LOC114323721 n=1 Tax=Camellia sinensis TaxID=4442 RepID=UPI001035784C|nr:uncharacterized protein LOC114323721 [Camellia sinensis]